MSPIAPMTLEELFETALLDALALLDEQEAALFERALLAAAPELRRRVREFQAEVATEPLLLADEDPGDALRTRTLASTSASIRRSRAELEPVAFVSEGRAMLPRRRSGAAFLRSALVWQAASFALLAALVTSIIFFARAVDEAREMARNVYREGAADLFREPLAKLRDTSGGDAWTIVRRAETKVALSNPDRSAVGMVFLKEDSASGSGEGGFIVVVAAYGLAEDVGLPELVATDEFSNEILRLPLERAADGSCIALARTATLTQALLASCTFRVVGGANEVLLS